MKNCWLFLYVLVVFVAGCSLSPTKMYESKGGFSEVIQSKTQRPIQITNNTIVVDARSRFDYSMAHYPDSVHVTWESYSQTRGRFPGRLQEDLDEAAKRLSMKGLTPEKPVVIIGYGNRGKGEAGRLAWTLFYLGFDDVQVVDDQVLTLSSNQVNSKPYPNAKPWTLKTRPQLVAGQQQVKQAVTKAQTGPHRVFLIDVRSKEEYFKKRGIGKAYALPDLGALQIEWKEFFDAQGRPDLSMVRQLEGIGMQKSSSIIVMSHAGVRSAAVNAALLSMGFYNASNFVDGLRSLAK